MKGEYIKGRIIDTFPANEVYNQERKFAHNDISRYFIRGEYGLGPRRAQYYRPTPDLVETPSSKVSWMIVIDGDGLKKRVEHHLSCKPWNAPFNQNFIMNALENDFLVCGYTSYPYREDECFIILPDTITEKQYRTLEYYCYQNAVICCHFMDGMVNVYRKEVLEGFSMIMLQHFSKNEASQQERKKETLKFIRKYVGYDRGSFQKVKKI